ncbi:respiratory chain complex I subunit 1 family protein [Acidithrix ferrooxidans]|uniref:Formate hydrogenlyase subunit 4 n=1 Tax=Acidithrix ferrooxidans TaxID=1280514 RepID=A0A0D8HH91_9ACTN|nr:NADH-quinone oxidoreductase subunit H [Acidithrix ferrooxidans]KJF17152.1 formate hydrogenlyase subunit 4 [Acidithrix ferrooxidans]
MSYLSLILQITLIVVISPLIGQLMIKIKSKAEGRRGPSLLQGVRELGKLLKKGEINPIGTGSAFALAPAIYLVSTLVLSAIIPLIALKLPGSSNYDLFWVVGILLIGTIALGLGGLDTATAFGGMGASRELMVAALIEPSILMAIYALSIRANSSNIFKIVHATLSNPQQIASPQSALALIGLVIVVVAEAGRIPIDNPSTHLELTMIHEAMVLEVNGPKLAMVKLASSMRLVILIGLVVNLFFPIGISYSTSSVGSIILGIVALVIKVSLLAGLLAFVEVFLAKLRLFRVPELLAGSFVFGFLAVTASYFLPVIKA